MIAQPAGVGEQMSKGDWCPVIGNFRYVFPHVVIERKFAIALEEHDRRRRELFGDGRDMEDGAGTDRRIRLEIGHAVAPLVDHAPVATHADRATRTVGIAPAFENAVDGAR